jgi:hypothetical protein
VLKLKKVMKPQVEPLFSFTPLRTGFRQVRTIKIQEPFAQMSAGRASSQVRSNRALQSRACRPVDHRHEHLRIGTRVNPATFL